MLEIIEISPLNLYDLTPKEVLLQINAITKRNKEDLKTQIAVAYFGEKFARSKKLPKLDKIMKELDTPTKKIESKGDMVLKAMAKEKGVDI